MVMAEEEALGPVLPAVLPRIVVGSSGNLMKTKSGRSFVTDG